MPGEELGSRTRHKRLVVLIVGIVFVLLASAGFFVLDATRRGSEEAGVGPEKGLIAPDFSARSLNGETVRLSDHIGKPVVLNFFAGWCGPCKKEAPHLQAAFEKGSGDFELFGVTFQDSEASAQNFLDEYDVTYPILLDDSEEVGKTYGVRSFPVTFFIRSDGVIHAVIKGPVTREFVLIMIENMTDA